MSKFWTADELAYLREHYATAPMDDMSLRLDRTPGAIYSYAKILRLRRVNQGRFDGTKIIGRRFEKGNDTRRRTWPPKKPRHTLTDSVLLEFERNHEQTIRTLAAATGSRASSCWHACDKLLKGKKIHVDRYDEKLAVYRLGMGVDALPPNIPKDEPEDDPYQIPPVPMPVLDFWHGAIFTTTARESGQEGI